MSKHKSPSQSPGLRRVERAAGVASTAATSELAKLDTDPAITTPAGDSSAQHEGMHHPLPRGTK